MRERVKSLTKSADIDACQLLAAGTRRLFRAVADAGSQDQGP